MTSAPVSVLVVDDSAVVRGLLSRALETDPQIRVAGTAMHGELALSQLRKDPVDVVILDVEMPVMDGLTALKHIQSEFPGVQVVMASSLTHRGAETTIEALALGAADCIAKPTAHSTAESIEQLVRELVPIVKALGQRPRAKGQGPRAKGTEHSALSPRLLALGHQPSIIVIGSSTGGPRALSQVLTAFPANFAVPILIVQHMPPLFTPMLAKHIAADTGRPCSEAVDEGRIERGHTYVAPGNYHVVIDKVDNFMVTRLSQTPPEHFCRPSVNPLFSSAALWYGKNALGVMLTGMGDDGIEGARDLAANGGYVIAQDEATSVVWGMPAAVCKENLAKDVLALSEIGPRISQICRQELYSV